MGKPRWLTARSMTPYLLQIHLNRGKLCVPSIYLHIYVGASIFVWHDFDFYFFKYRVHRKYIYKCMVWFFDASPFFTFVLRTFVAGGLWSLIDEFAESWVIVRRNWSKRDLFVGKWYSERRDYFPVPVCST